jgi:penicillin-binding protein 1C
VLVATNAKLPPPLRHFQPDRLAGAGRPGLHILYPPNGARLDLAETGGKPDPVPLKVTGVSGPLTVLVDGVPVANPSAGALFFKPASPGFSRVTVMDASGATDSVVVRIEDPSAARGIIRAASAACPISPCDGLAGSAVPK